MTTPQLDGLIKKRFINYLPVNLSPNNRHVIIQGATGTGKSYLTNALCRYVIEEGHTARYVRMYDLLPELSVADIEDRLPSYLKKISKLDVLVIDDFLLTPTTEHEQKYLMEVFELRSRDHSLILPSQMETGEWHKKTGWWSDCRCDSRSGVFKL